MDAIQEWYASKGWEQLPFQKEVLQEYLAEKNGLLNAPTGSGKTYAMWIPVLANWIKYNPDYKTKKENGLQVIWITPLRALAKDISLALQQACDDLDVPWKVEMRTGDTSTTTKQKQAKSMPECLVTTPESLHVLFAQKDYSRLFKKVQLVVVDEWHELMGSKRGIQTELVLARLRSLNNSIRIWGISATIGNLEQAMKTLLGTNKTNYALIKANIEKSIVVNTLLPKTVERYSWVGHLGTQLITATIPIIEKNNTTLIFTNVRSQTELWYQRFTDLYPKLAKDMALHHGSLSKEVRDKVEEDLHAGTLKAVIATSSLDLGVDFRPVDAVIQVGSPKGVARFMQRAGRAGHSPGETSTIYFLPTNSLEILESIALQDAMYSGNIEPRVPLKGSYDVLVQYLITLAVSEGFKEDALYKEIKSTHAYKDLEPEEWQWALEFITKGGKVLGAYSQYRKVIEKDGVYKVEDRQIAMRHRMSIGTITSEEIMAIRLTSGRSLGSVEESFASRLQAGDVFWYAGQSLRFVKIREMTLFVQKAPAKNAITPRWYGGRIALTSYVADFMRKRLHQAQQGTYEGKEMQALKPLLKLQQELSDLPAEDEFLVETLKSKEGYHLFFYPYAGRLAHEGLSALFAWRIAKKIPATFSIAMNDYGFELLSEKRIGIDAFLNDELFSTHDLHKDILSSINGSQMAKRKFRDISKIAGLIFQGYPGKSKKSKHLQSSAELLFDIFMKYDASNLLVKQAFNEVLSQELDIGRISQALNEMKKKKLVLSHTNRPTPFSFPIMVDRLRQQLTTEQLEDRVAKMELKKSA